MQKKTNSYEFIITDSNYNRLNDENMDEIVKGYVKEDMDSIFAYSKIKKKGEQPYLIIVFQKNGFLHFNTTRKSKNTWSTIFEDSLNGQLNAYFSVSDWNLEIKELDNNRIGIFLNGCYPHSCDTRAGLFYYDCKNDKGYISFFSDEENFKKLYPFEVPTDYVALKMFEEAIYEKNQEKFNPPNFNKIRNNIIALPLTRYIPPTFWVEKAIFSQVANKFETRDLKNYDDIKSCYFFDYNEDKYLDCLFITSTQVLEDSLATKISILSGKSNQIVDFNLNNETIENDGRSPSELISYNDSKESYLIMVFDVGGNAGINLKFYLFKLNNESFSLLKDDKLLNDILIKMQFKQENYN